MSKFFHLAGINKLEGPSAQILNAARTVAVRFLPLLNIGLGALIASLVITYLFQTNIVTTKGFELSSLETQQKKLQEEHQSLDLELTRLESLTEVGEKLKALTLTPVAEVSYLTPEKPALAYDEGTQRK